MHHPTDRIAHTTAFVTPVVEHWLGREIAQWIHSMKDRSDDPSHHEQTLLPRSYISLLRETKDQLSSLRSRGRKSLSTSGSSVVRAFAHGAMGRRIDPSWGGPLSYLSFQPVLQDWCNKGCGMCYPVCGMVHIKEPAGFLSHYQNSP